MADASSSSSASAMAKNRCETELKVKKSKFVWIIEKFSSCEMVVGESLKSRTFSIEADFVYTGETPKLLAEEGMAQELLVAADKYQLLRLKALCEQQLFASLDKDNACGVLELADRHSAEQLKACTMEYIGEHMDEVKKTEGWHALSNLELVKQP